MVSAIIYNNIAFNKLFTLLEFIYFTKSKQYYSRYWVSGKKILKVVITSKLHEGFER